MRLARRARKSDSNYLHAQLILAGQTVVNDVIVQKSHVYYFDCGCIRTYDASGGPNGLESLEPCKRHANLIARHPR